MFPSSWLEPFAPLTLPTIIFVAETVVVTLSTIRIIFIARGMKKLASLVGLFEVSMWLFAIGQVMRNLSDLRCSAAFAGGFTLGNYLGVLIHDKLAIGHVGVRIITSKDAGDLVEALKLAEYGVTCLDATGAKGPVQIVMTVIKRRDLPRVQEIIKGFDDRVFYSVDDLHSAAEGVFPCEPARTRPQWLGWAARLPCLPGLHGKQACGPEPSPAQAELVLAAEASGK